MAAHHSDIVVPGLEVRHWLAIDGAERESCNIFDSLVEELLSRDLEEFISNRLLLLKDAHYQRLQNVESSHAVGVRTLAILRIETVASEEEFRDVSAIVVRDVKLASGMDSFKAVSVEHEVIENDKSSAFFDLLGHFLRGKYMSFILTGTLVKVFRQLDLSVGVLVSDAVDSFKDDDEDAECEQAEDAEHSSFITLESVPVVSLDAAHDSDITEQEHDVPEVAMDLGNKFDFLFLCPLLVTIIEVHHTSCDESRDGTKDGDYYY